MVKIQIKKSVFKISGEKFLELTDACFLSNGLYKLHGDNGSGKTIFLEYLTGLRKSDNIKTDLDRSRILYLGETGIGIEDLTIMENIKLVYWIFGIELTSRTIDKINSLYTEEQLKKIYHQSSFGMQLMVGLSLLFAETKWDLIILDETLAGIDQGNKELILQEIAQRENESIIFLVAHEYFKTKIEYKEVSIIDRKIQFKQ